MKKGNAIILSAVLVGIFYLFFQGRKDAWNPKDHPGVNIILIVIDTLRADHLGCYGYNRNTSPIIDALAAEGILFKDMRAQSSWTRSSTAAILSGLYPKNHGASSREDSLAEEVFILPEILGQYGYDSYAFITNGNAGAHAGFAQGYTNFFHFRERPRDVEPNIHVRSDEVNESLFKFIRQLKSTSSNFFYIHYSDPHEPHIPKEKNFSRENKIVFSMDRFQPASIQMLSDKERPGFLKEMIDAYDDEIWYNDKMIGNLIQVLKETNMYSNSIIIITSDHGQEFLEHNGLSHGKTLFEEQLKIPLIIRLPGNHHKTVEEIANQVDIVPTILALLGKPVPPQIDGYNLLEKKRYSKNSYSYAELHLDKKILSSIQTKNKKLIEGIVMPKPEKNQLAWFKDNAVLTTSAEALDLHIRSFRRKRKIQVFVDDELIGEFVITPVKKKYNIQLPKSVKNKTVIIKSLAPCESPVKFGMKDKRCLAFCIYNSNNIDVNDITGEIFKEYFALENDPGEKNNLYNSNEFKKNIVQLRKELKQYKLTRRFIYTGKKPVNFDDEQLNALKALGYIN